MATVVSVSGYKDAAGQGFVAFKGSGFGAQTPGSVVLVSGRGGSNGPAEVVSWSDTEVVVKAVANAFYKSYMLRLAAGGRPIVQTKLEQPISTHNLAQQVPWTITSVEASVPGLKLYGVNTGLVASASLRDATLGELPAVVEQWYDPPSYAQNAIILHWPSDGPFDRATITSSTGLTEAITGNWVPALAPEFTSASQVSGTVTITGSNLGLVDDVGIAFSDGGALSSFWGSSLFVSRQSGSIVIDLTQLLGQGKSIESIRLSVNSYHLSTTLPSPLLIALSPLSITSVTSPASNTIRYTGVFRDVNEVRLFSALGLRRYYDPAGPNAASNAALGGVDAGTWTWSGTVIELVDAALGGVVINDSAMILLNGDDPPELDSEDINLLIQG